MAGKVVSMCLFGWNAGFLPLVSRQAFWLASLAVYQFGVKRIAYFGSDKAFHPAFAELNTESKQLARVW